ncbi:MAG: cobalt-precorrin-5B (C(1))-methyltransferase CbiD [Oscillospiraceae bacterium]|nr:cobalt-precorrin-5B (C(1))-methyltransferase CbiD [Oscillospiraceae bacterium]
MTQVRLTASELSAGYDGKAVVKDISFTVRSGEIATLIGPNGAGKSTILKAIARRLAPLGGTLLLNGEALHTLSASDAARALSVLTTERVRADTLRVRDVVSLGRYPYTGALGLLTPHDRAVTEQTMERLGIQTLSERGFDTLSDGQRQRVLLARAVCQEPRVLVLDEPTSYLDVRHEIETLTLLRALARERGIAVVLSLHALSLARRVSDTVLAVKNGGIDRAGPPEEVFAAGYVDTLYDMPRGTYASFFAPPQQTRERAYAFFQNRACEKFPCHKGVAEEDFNCLFCYCPLYALGERCGGNFHYTDKGYKSCVDCSFPHKRENYARILERYGELAELAKPGARIRSGQKLLRCGYTTGVCAACATDAAAHLLLCGEAGETVRLVTPKGTEVVVTPAYCRMEGDAAVCAVRKDAGDDPDVTDGCLVCASVRRTASGITVDGGAGVGRVTKPGLDRSVGEAAINSVPRRMIAEAARAAVQEARYDGGLSVVISVPGGEALAKKTFNPLLGIEGGISILGTSGVVEPMSERAVVDTIEAELRQKRAEGAARVVLTPGNYGADFLRTHALVPEGIPSVRYSNFLGDALDLAVTLGFAEALLVGHVGKLVKLAGGIMNTHSKYADCRAELFCAHAALCGADAALCRHLMDAATTDACLALLDGAGLRAPVLKSLLAAMQRHLDRRTGQALRAGAVLFSNEYGLLGMTETAEAILKDWRN